MKKGKLHRKINSVYTIFVDVLKRERERERERKRKRERVGKEN